MASIYSEGRDSFSWGKAGGRGSRGKSGRGKRERYEGVPSVKEGVKRSLLEKANASKGVNSCSCLFFCSI